MKAPRIYARGGFFWVRYFLSGRKNEVRKSTGLQLDVEPGDSPDWWKRSRHRPKLLALLKDIEFSREAQGRGYEVEERKAVPTLEELLAEFNETNAIERDRERSKATLVHRGNAVQFFKKHLRGEWYAVDRAMVLALRKAAKAHLSPASLRGYFVVLKMLFAYAVREEYVRSNPFEGVTVSVPKRAPARIEPGDEQSLFRFLYHARRPLFDQVMFQRLTGLRAGDVCALECGAVKDGVLIYQNSKAHREEEVPLSAAAILLLSKIPPRPQLFAYRNRRTVGYYLERASVFAGTPHIRTHQLKRSYLQELARVKPDERTFDALAHHAAKSNQVAVDHYSGQDKELMLEALEGAQAPWLAFLTKLFQEEPKGGKYAFANKQ